VATYDFKKKKQHNNSFLLNLYPFEDSVCQWGGLGRKAYTLQYADIMKKWRPVPADISVPIGSTGERKLTQYSKQRYLLSERKEHLHTGQGPTIKLLL
jgi:hypothetical protein